MTLFDSIARAVDRDDAFVLATVIAGQALGAKAIFYANGDIEGTLGSPDLMAAVKTAAADLLRLEVCDSRTVTLPEGDYEVFLDSFVPPPRLVIIGAVETAQALTRFAKQLGYRVIVTDARAAFATEERFPDADEVLKGWPQDVLPGIRFDDSTYVVLLSHDPKFDEPTLAHVLPLSPRYIGAIGSRRTQKQRRERLLAEGFDEQTVDRIHGPVGLDLGGKTAEEIAISILAEITAVRRERPGGMMSATAS